MKFAVLADIHGNLPALEAVFDDLTSQSVDGILVLGDLVSRAPYPVETFDLLAHHHCTLLSGNGEAYLFNYDAKVRRGELETTPRTAINRWTYHLLGEERMAVLRALPTDLRFAAPGASPMHLTHASPYSERTGIVPDDMPKILDAFISAQIVPPDFSPSPFAHWFSALDEDVLGCAHTHFPWVRQQGARLAFNPGSVGMSLSLDGCARPAEAQYALITWQAPHWQVELRHLAYDSERLKRAYTTSGLLEAGRGFSQAFLINALTGVNVANFYFMFAHQVAKEWGYTGIESLPDLCWDKIESLFPWEEYPDR